uniref:Sushi domain-containing protein n=1 Tax=Seriola dumerili TaxID=41447 RepID=A0A3B4VI03_SERDU
MKLFHRLWLFILWLNVDESLQQNEITCDRKDPHVYYWDVYSGQNITLDETVSYWCKPGYNSTDGATWATCTRDGWRPNPLCQGIVKLHHCAPPPKVENAVAVTSYQREYLSGSEVTYRCRDHYTMEGDATIICNNGQWEEKNITCTRTYIQKHFTKLPNVFILHVFM